MVHRRGALFFLDAIQGLGVFPLDLSQGAVDFLAAAGHKWLLGPEGAGLFYVKREHLDLLRPLSVGWNSVQQGNAFSRSELRLRQAASRYESGSQKPGRFYWFVGEGSGDLGGNSDCATINRQSGRRVLQVTDGSLRALSAVGATISATGPATMSNRGLCSSSCPGETACS